MREIKFRGKRKDDGKWIYGNLVILRNKYFICEKDTSIFDTYFEHCFKEVIPETVGQYTGLKDKNGKEIFEDDIVDDNWYDVYGEKINKYLIVKFGEYCGLDYYDYPNYGFYLENENGEQYALPYHEPIKIIGNIHDNPELLK